MMTRRITIRAMHLWLCALATSAAAGDVQPTVTPTPCLPPPMAPPAAIYPPEGEMNVPLTVDFQWEPSCAPASLYLMPQGGVETEVCTNASGGCTVDSLQPGTLYFWRFDIADATPCHECLTSISAGSWAFFTVAVNLPPTGGTFAVTPGSGVPLSTVFTFNASGWSDPEEDNPLGYQFSFYPDGAPGSEVVFQPFSQATAAHSVLPAGVIIPVLTVRDSLGNFARVEHGAIYVGAGTPTPAPSATPASTPTATPTPAACFPGDADNSCGAVNAADFLAVQAVFGADNGPGGYGDADCSGGPVNAADFLAVQANFGMLCGG